MPDKPTTRRLPPWLKKRVPADGRAAEDVSRLLAELDLATVCREAHCPNQGECFSRGTAAFMILGDRCTRNCRFCAVLGGDPAPPDADEPQAVAQAAARLALRHVVVTSVTRDDLDDGGAAHFADTIRAVRARLPKAALEVLTPDFQGRSRDVITVLDARPDIFNHNVETVPRLYPAVRPQADFARSLAVLVCAKARARAADMKLHTKSGLMVGLGETGDEVHEVMQALREAGCDMLTIGQYLAPSDEHVPVARYVEPGEFAAWKVQARQMGFSAVAAGPFVRSSYHAEDLLAGMGCDQ
ncbi:MAG: lipoyl synthase [Phycisphaerae bacterium]|nr:lipoyl synthase [Phycisphaerae bacterium]